MSGTSDAREEILRRIRDGLREVPIGPELPWEMGPDALTPGAPGGLDEPAARLARFREMLERVGGHFHYARGGADATEIVRGIVLKTGAERVAFSDAREVRLRLEDLSDELVLIPHDANRTRLLRAELGLSTAQWGVAETGTIVLESAAEHHRLASLVPPVHVALVEEASIVPTLNDVLRELRTLDQETMSRTITMITGPSRTADIELTLVVGVHGPRELHVIVLEREEVESA